MRLHGSHRVLCSSDVTVLLRSRKISVSKVKEPCDGADGWNLYVLSTVTTLQLYSEMVHSFILVLILKKTSLSYYYALRGN